MKYVRVTGNAIEYSFSTSKLKTENPNTSFPREMSEEMLAEYNVFPVLETAPPATDQFHYAREATPALLNGEWVQTWEVVPSPPPKSITRRQCALMLHTTGMITIEEALEMTKTAVVPAAIGALFANLAPPRRIRAEIDFAAMNYYRNNPLIVDMMQSAGFTPEMTDAFFIAAAQL